MPGNLPIRDLLLDINLKPCRRTPISNEKAPGIINELMWIGQAAIDNIESSFIEIYLNEIAYTERDLLKIIYIIVIRGY